MSERLGSFRILLDDAMRLTRNHFRSVYPAVALPVLVVALLQFVANIPFLRLMTNPQSVEGTDLGAFVAQMAVMGVATLLYLVIYMLAHSVLLSAATSTVLEGRAEPGRHWRWVVRPKVLGTLLLLGVLVLVGFVFCILPGLIIGIVFGLTIPVMATEQRYGTAALSRAKELIMYNPQGGLSTLPAARLFVIGVVGGLLSYAARLVVQAPFMVAQQVVMVRSLATAEGEPGGLPAAWAWLQLPQAAFGVLANMAVMVYVCMAVALLFDHVRRQKEGRDLDLLMDELGAPSVLVGEA